MARFITQKKKLKKNIATAYITARKYLDYYIDRRVRGEKKNDENNQEMFVYFLKIQKVMSMIPKCQFY